MQKDCKALADLAGSVCSGLDAGLQRDGRTDGVRPAGVLKADRLDALDDLVGVEALRLAELAALLHGADAVLREDAVDLVDSSFVTFKQSHFVVLLLLFLARVDILRRVVPLTVVAGGVLQGLVGVHALLHGVHHLAQADELVADDLVLAFNARRLQ